jgi:hypothetical protein
MKNVLQMNEPEREAHEQLETAATAGKWMNAVFHIGEDGRIYLTRTTTDFPVAAMGPALKLLWRNMAEALIGPMPEPLPVADLGRSNGNVVPNFFKTAPLPTPDRRDEALGLEEAIDRR